MKQGLPAIRNYFKQIEEQKSVAVYEAKLLFVGEPGSGKTSLIKKVINPSYKVPSDDNEASTLGIIVHTGWQFAYCKEESITFSANLWDFCGQEIQYMIHQFVLTPHSLYLLLADDRKQHTHFDYWFNIITLLSEAGKYEKTPVIVVLNEINHKSITNFDHNNYRTRYPELDIKCMEVGLSINDNRFETLNEQIRKSLSNLNHIGDELPSQWLLIRKELEDMKWKNHIKINEFFDVCRGFKITKEEDMLLLAGYLHDLGIILHFRSDSSLADTLFLNPQWAVDAIYAALSDKTLEVQKGRFTQDCIFGLWAKYNFEERNKFLRLMLKDNFELCYRIDNRRNEYISPQLLPSVKPDIQPPASRENLRFRFFYPFMPEGILWRLIVRMNDFICSNSGDDLVWKEGVLLEKNEVKALVTGGENREGLKVIDINLFNGMASRKKEFLTEIRAEIKKIHKTPFTNIKCYEMVPCVCIECIKSDTPYYYKYESLEKHRANKRETIICDASSKDVNIIALMDAVFSSTEIYEKRDFEYGFERVGKPDVPPETRTTDTPQIFISYANSGESKKIAETICERFKAKGIKLVMDKSDINYKDNITKFMKRIGEGKYVVVIISKEYLKSKYCMFEMLEIQHNGNFNERIYPLVFEDCGILDDEDRLDYIIYWQEKKKKLKEKMDKIEKPEVFTSANNDLRLYGEIEMALDSTTNKLRDMKTIHMKNGEEDYLEEIVTAIERQIEEDGAGDYCEW